MEEGRRVFYFSSFFLSRVFFETCFPKNFFFSREAMKSFNDSHFLVEWRELNGVIILQCYNRARIVLDLNQLTPVINYRNNINQSNCNEVYSNTRMKVYIS